MARDARVDGYIARAPEFARAVIGHFRDIVHETCPEVEEGMKWGRPAFLREGRLMVLVGAFQAHCAVAFWHPEMNRMLNEEGKLGMEGAGSFGKIRGVKELPAKRDLARYLREAWRLAGEAAARPGRRKEPRAAIDPPADFVAALARNGAAARAFEAFSLSQQREYVEWIEEAKRDETRRRRIATAVEWLAEGKGRNWRYEG